MTKKTDTPKSDSKHSPKPASHVDVTPKKTAASTTTSTTTTSPLHSGDDPGRMPLQPSATTTADHDPDHGAPLAPDSIPVVEPLPPPAALSVPVPDPSPTPEPHQPSGADEIMRRHRLVDPEVAEAKIEAEAEAETATKTEDKEDEKEKEDGGNAS